MILHRKDVDVTNQRMGWLLKMSLELSGRCRFNACVEEAGHTRKVEGITRGRLDQHEMSM